MKTVTFRILLSLASLSPLFLLWGIKGTEYVPDVYWITLMFVLIVVPNALLSYHVLWVKEIYHEMESVRVEKIYKRDDYLSLYFFSVIMPAFALDIDKPREVAASVVAVFILVFFYYKLKLYTVIPVFIMLGYMIYEIELIEQSGVGSSKKLTRVHAFVISRRFHIDILKPINGYRITMGFLIDSERQ
ncbi:MAG: hypothetical protein RLY86_543 [Pseudomonadota bacterium]|jgi:hypothetical protein